jgi:O-antigen/teichoic acid export membrane protein
MQDSLYRNSIYLILNSGLMAFVGFIFWIIGAHLYPASKVGIATTLVSLTTVLLLFSYLGLNNSIVRFLPSEKNPNELIDSIFWVTSIAACIVGTAFILDVRHLVPALSGLHNPIIGTLFVAYIIIGVQNIITDTIFLAKRVTIYTFLANLGLSVCKLTLPFILLSVGSSGLFLSHALGVTASTILSLYFAAKYLHYVPRPRINFNQIKRMFKFSATNYVANFMVSAPPMLLPVIVTNRLGTKESAYFYIATAFASLIYIVPNVTTNAMFAESSNNEAAIQTHIKQALKFILAIIIPLCLLIIPGARFVLTLFGHGYSTEGAEILRIFSATALFMTINYISATTLQVKLRMSAMVTITTIGAIVITVGAYHYATHSLNDVAWSWFIGQGIMSLLFILYLGKAMLSVPRDKVAQANL